MQNCGQPSSPTGPPTLPELDPDVPPSRAADLTHPRNLKDTVPIERQASKQAKPTVEYASSTTSIPTYDSLAPPDKPRGRASDSLDDEASSVEAHKAIPSSKLPESDSTLSALPKLDNLDNKYHYSPLSRPGSIRLLRLMPHHNEKHEKSDRIQCKLFNYPLQESIEGMHPYEALSYVWGCSDKHHSISVDGCDLPVTENLHAALLRLRGSFLDRMLWVDAICINQEDEDEKGQQVQSMAKIYAKASRVIVWLGEAAADSDQALEEIRIAAVKQSTNPAINETNHQQAILTLLERPWFQRIWVLQEVAAARHVLIKCGPTEIDGYAFCSGLSALKLSYETCPDLEGLIRSVAYLIRDAVFRPRGETGRSGRFSLDIRPLTELVDMYHTREAKERHDKVYALLGMSSDDPSAAGLSANYKTPWKEVFQKLVNFSISDRMFVGTWDDEEVAVIKGKGCVLGEVSRVERDVARDDRQSVDITWKHAPKHFNTKEEPSSPWTFQASAKSIRVGDAVCLLQGASRPTIVRLCHDYSAVILIAAPLPDDRTTSIKWLERLRRTATFPNDFLLVWDWNVSRGKSQDGEDYANFMTSRGMLKSPKTELQDYLDKATRLRDVGLLLHGMERYEDAAKNLREAVKACDTAWRSVDNPELAPPGHGPRRKADAWELVAMVDLLVEDKEGWASLCLAAWNGNEAILKLLLNTNKVDPDSKDQDGRTPLSWAAWKGYEAIVELLLDTGKVNPDSKDKDGRTPLSYAAENGSGEIVEQLLHNGADANAQDKEGMSALHWATEKGHEEAVSVLIGENSNVNVKDKGGATPLARAIDNRSKGVLETLLKNGAELNYIYEVPEDDLIDLRRTPLLRAVEKRDSYAVEKLLRHGARPTFDGKLPLTPPQLAERLGDEKIVNMLKPYTRWIMWG